MIDVEAQVFNAVYPAVTAIIPKKNFKSQYVASASSFPFATLIEMDNITDTKHRDTAEDENFAIVTYEANAYAMTKAECRRVMDAIDTQMIRLNFTRIDMRFTPNLPDPNIYRMTARYQAVADANNVIYRRNY